MRTSFSKLSLLALPLAALTACQDYEPFSEAEVREAAAIREFTNNFEQRYGKIDPNHDWGFGPMEACAPIAETRGDVPSIDVKLNEWLKTYANVPGYPFLDGDYVQVGSTGDNNGNPVIKPVAQKSPTTDYPYGDVTDYEMLYVSEWFRTHHKDDPDFTAAKVSLNVSEFFIQNVSADADQESYDKSNHGYGTNITQIPNGNGGNSNCTFQLDKLACMGVGGNRSDIVNISSNDCSWSHINNFNSGKTVFDPENKEESQRQKREIKLVTCAGTSDFACMASMSEGDEINKWIYDWVLVSLEWDEEYNHKTYHRQGYYLAFDYSTKKPSEKIDYGPDGYYSNWIVKITPAMFVPTPQVKRIMCEDLGNTFDFDFNDVVFDVRYEKNNSNQDVAIIVLQAAGGTMPIYVGVRDDAHEAHKMLLGSNASTSSPINVISGGLTAPIATYRLGVVSSTDPDDIIIYVDNDRNGESYELPKANRGNLAAHDGSNGYNGGETINEGGAGRSYAPQKFAVPSDVRWMKETMQIETSYDEFEDWVENANYVNQENGLPWYHNSNILSTANLWSGKGYTGEAGGGTPTGGSTDPVGHILTVTLDDSRMGTVSGSGTYNVGDDVTIKAEASDGFEFVRWKWNNENDTFSTDATCTFKYTADMASKGSMKAYFKNSTSPATYTVHISAGANGKITINSTEYSGDNSYNQSGVAANTQISVTATANDGYHFTKWNDNNTDATRTITVNSDVNLTAQFEQDGAAPTGNVSYFTVDPELNNATISNKTVTFTDANYGAVSWYNGAALKGGTYKYLVIDIASSDCALSFGNSYKGSEAATTTRKVIVQDVSSVDANNTVQLSIQKSSGAANSKVVFNDIYLTNVNPNNQ